MTTGKPPAADPAADLDRSSDRVRAEITEARGTLKDLRYEIHQARQARADLTREIADARAAVPLLVAEHIQAEVEKQITALGEITERAMRDSVARVSAKFDELHDRARGGIPIPDLIQQYAARRQDRTTP